MFSFFKKRQPLPQTAKGTFSAYDIDYVYEFLGKERVEDRIAGSQDYAAMGIPFKEFVEREVSFNNRGALYVFSEILGYFDNDVDLAIFLYDKSKIYNEGNYHDTPNAKKKFEEYIAKIRMIIESRPENEGNLKTKLQSNYWIDYHYFYSQIFQILHQSLKDASRLQKELCIDFEGSYVVNKDKIIKDNLTLEIKIRRKPKTDKYILFREDGIYYDLRELEYDIYEFKSLGRKFKVIVQGGICEIINLGFTTIDNNNQNLIVPAYARQILNEIIERYIPNYCSITDRMGVEFGWEKPPTNGFIFDAISFYHSEGNIEGVKRLTEIGSSIPNTWNVNWLDNLEDEDE